MRRLRHDNVVGYIDSFTSDGQLNIVLDYCAGGDLSQRIKAAKEARQPFDERTIMLWFAQIANALAFVHYRRILHRDLKTQNIFLTERGVVKLGDFGIARVGACSYEVPLARGVTVVWWVCGCCDSVVVPALPRAGSPNAAC